MYCTNLLAFISFFLWFVFCFRQVVQSLYALSEPRAVVQHLQEQSDINNISHQIFFYLDEKSICVEMRLSGEDDSACGLMEDTNTWHILNLCMNINSHYLLTQSKTVTLFSGFGCLWVMHNKISTWFSKLNWRHF